MLVAPLPGCGHWNCNTTWFHLSSQLCLSAPVLHEVNQNCGNLTLFHSYCRDSSFAYCRTGADGLLAVQLRRPIDKWSTLNGCMSSGSRSEVTQPIFIIYNKDRHRAYKLNHNLMVKAYCIILRSSCIQLGGTCEPGSCHWDFCWSLELCPHEKAFPVHPLANLNWETCSGHCQAGYFCCTALNV